MRKMMPIIDKQFSLKSDLLLRFPLARSICQIHSTLEHFDIRTIQWMEKCSKNGKKKKQKKQKRNTERPIHIWSNKCQSFCAIVHVHKYATYWMHT